MTASERDKHIESLARLHAVELLDALVDMIPYAHGYLLDRVRTMAQDVELQTDGLPGEWEPASRYRKASGLVQKIVRSN